MDFGGSFTTLCHLKILMSTLKLLNINIIDEFNLILMDFGSSFTMLYHLEILLPTFYYALSYGNPCVYFETFKRYYY